MKEIAFTFFFVGLLIFCISLGKWIAYWWEDRPMSKKQKEKCIKWETENGYLPEN